MDDAGKGEILSGLWLPGRQPREGGCPRSCSVESLTRATRGSRIAAFMLCAGAWYDEQQTDDGWSIELTALRHWRTLPRALHRDPRIEQGDLTPAQVKLLRHVVEEEFG